MKKTFVIILFLFLISTPPKTFAQTPVNPLIDITNDSPSLTIVSPETKSTIFGNQIEVSFIVRNFIFVGFNNQIKNAKNQGHMLVFLDEENPSSESGRVITKAVDFTISDLKPGNHKLKLALVNNDQTPLNPPIEKSVEFNLINKAKDVDWNENINKDKEKQILGLKKVNYLLLISSFSILGIILLLVLFRRKNH